VETEMKAPASHARTNLLTGSGGGLLLLARRLLGEYGGKAQTLRRSLQYSGARTECSRGACQLAASNEEEAPPVSLSPTATAGQRTDRRGRS